MPGHRDVWRCEADGSVAAYAGAFRLVVRPPGDARGPERFVMLRREGGDGPHALVGSGAEPDVRAAMEKAARMADRLVAAPGMRPFLSGRCSTGKTAGAPCAS
jgi:hypothetical protein